MTAAIQFDVFASVLSIAPAQLPVDLELSSLSLDELDQWAETHCEGGYPRFDDPDEKTKRQQLHEVTHPAARRRLAASGIYDPYLTMPLSQLLEFAEIHLLVGQSAPKLCKRAWPNHWPHEYKRHALTRNSPRWFYEAIVHYPSVMWSARFEAKHKPRRDPWYEQAQQKLKDCLNLIETLRAEAIAAATTETL